MIKELTGRAPSGYRAPAFSVNRDTVWAYRILGELGFAWDSSQFDSPRVPGGSARSRVAVRAHRPGGGQLLELPLAILPVGARPEPAGRRRHVLAVPARRPSSRARSGTAVSRTRSTSTRSSSTRGACWAELPRGSSGEAAGPRAVYRYCRANPGRSRLRACLRRVARDFRAGQLRAGDRYREESVWRTYAITFRRRRARLTGCNEDNRLQRCLPPGAERPARVRARGHAASTQAPARPRRRLRLRPGRRGPPRGRRLRVRRHRLLRADARAGARAARALRRPGAARARATSSRRVRPAVRRRRRARRLRLHARAAASSSPARGVPARARSSPASPAGTGSRARSGRSATRS